ncbi:MAG: conjugal transfer protein TraN, partial [Rhodocyclaceae bacterium]
GAMNNWASDLGTGSTFGAYGFSFSFSVDSGFQFVAFDPYTFAAQIAIMMVEEWLACAANEQALAMKKGQNLCVFVGSYCASKVPIINVCVELKQQSCCFNSLLAKIVNRQGRAQLGLPGNQCGGFNETQLKALNFSQMDFSEFIATITPPAPNLTAVTSQVNATVRQKVQNYYQQTP